MARGTGNGGGLIPPEHIEPKVTLNVSLDESVAAELDEYIKFNKSRRQYMIQEIIRRWIAKDVVFKDRNKPKVAAQKA